MTVAVAVRIGGDTSSVDWLTLRIAASAVAVQIQAVMSWRESGRGGGLGQLCVDQLLQPLTEVNIGQRSTGQAHEMVVMVDERLGQLEVGVVGGAGDPADHTAPFEYLQVPVGRTLGYIGVVGGNLGEGHRSAGSGQCLDQPAAAAGVSMLVMFEPSGHQYVKISQLATRGLTRRACR